MQHPFPSGFIMLNAYPSKENLYSIPVKPSCYPPRIVCNDVCPNCLDCLAVSIYPSHSVSLWINTQILFVLNDDLTCISLTVQTKVASWPTSTVMLFISSTNRGFIFITAPAVRKCEMQYIKFEVGDILPFWARVTINRERSNQYLWLILMLSIFIFKRYLL